MSLDFNMDKSVEVKWLREWESRKTFESDPNPKKQSSLVTVPFPYMNGPLHIGHGFTYTRADVYARFKRMSGFNVLFPWAWHWTGQPIVAAAERLSKGDPAMTREFEEIDGIPKDQLQKFYDPKYMAQYYTDSGREALKRLGLSVDWRREFHTTDLEPNFNKFVLWQYNKLREKGFVTRGTHPVIWCPRDQSPTGDHDRLSGEGVTWEEFTLVKFELVDDVGKEMGIYLPTATFRPETIFGVTNLWLNPRSNYVEVQINEKDHWIVSLPASTKLRNQLRKIDVVKEFSGAELIGKKIVNPVGQKRFLIILPAEFVDPDNGSGVVYSVPAHAPTDYVALNDLKSDTSRLRGFNISESELKEIVPIPLISIPGMGEFPAIEEVEKLGITNQSDPRLSIATEEIYRKEFHQGVLNKNCGPYQGKRVSEAKTEIIQFLKNNGLADSMYDLPEKVICRCMTECIVKILEDQWFLKYSDPDWKKLAHECVNIAEVFPESARQWFHDVIDWLKDWPCARRVGLGTPLPWSPGWIVETLSDSTIYMCFYTINATLKRLDVQPDSLTNDFFDYVFLGNGEDLDVLSSKTKLSLQALRSMREEFLYWYPVRLRNSAKELIPNHLTFFIFQHVAFFPKNLWPTGLSANGMVAIEGTKMSKSKGNVVPLREALDEHGADTVRAGLIGGSEGMDDLDWRERYVKEVSSKVNGFPSFVISLSDESRKSGFDNFAQADFWLESQIQNHISKVISSIEGMKTKTAFQEAFYNYWITIRRYLNRTSEHPAELLEYASTTWVKLLSPFMPFTCEELNSVFGSKELVSTTEFPKVDTNRIHIAAELSEFLIDKLVQDVHNITKLLYEKPKRLFVYLAPAWKYNLFRKEIESRRAKSKTSELLRRFFESEPSISKKEIADTLPRITKTVNELGEDFVNKILKETKALDEKSAYGEAQQFLAKELEIEIQVKSPNEPGIYDPKEKAKFALPFKPALYLE